jgi:hypothetical protein
MGEVTLYTDCTGIAPGQPQPASGDSYIPAREGGVSLEIDLLGGSSSFSASFFFRIRATGKESFGRANPSKLEGCGCAHPARSGTAMKNEGDTAGYIHFPYYYRIMPFCTCTHQQKKIRDKLPT